MEHRTYLIFLLLLSPLTLFADDDGHGEGGSPSTPSSSSACSSQLVLPGSVNFPFSTSNFSCNSAWSPQSFTLMYQNTGAGLWSFVLTAPDKGDGGYISIGFSSNGGMVGSSAIAGWITGGKGVVKQYLLGGRTSDTCVPDTGNLKVVAKSMSIVSYSKTLYMGFQLQDTTTPSKNLIYALGSPKSTGYLNQHSAQTSTTIDYTTGQASSPSTPSSGSPSSRDSKTSMACAKLGVSGNLIPFDTSSLSCNNAWSSYDFTLYYKRNGTNIWSFVLSTPDSGSYVAIGFSSNGKMVGTSAIAGWNSGSGGKAKLYYLGGTSSGDCPPDQSNLALVGSPVAVVQSSRIYLAFQLHTSQPESNLIYAIGPDSTIPGSDSLLAYHKDKVSTYINYATGESSTTSDSDTLRTVHGLFGLLGWGVLAPIGVMMARYAKQWDPMWFYSHIVIQCTAFVFGAICVFTGASLEDKVTADVDDHKALGIVVMVMGILQLFALLIRPDKTAKLRRYWNWYHHNVGRIAIILAVGNIFYGIHLAHEDSWNIGYGIILGFLVVAHLGLEAWMRLRD